MNIHLKFLFLAFALGACSSQTKHTESGQEIVCLKSPVGSVLPDDLYVSKLSGPVYMRCPKNTFPAVVMINSDGSKTVKVISSPGNAGPSNAESLGVNPVEKLEFATAGEGSAGAAEKDGDSYESSIAVSDGKVGGVNRASATENGVTTNSDDAKKFTQNVMDDINALKNTELNSASMP